MGDSKTVSAPAPVPEAPAAPAPPAAIKREVQYLGEVHKIMSLLPQRIAEIDAMKSGGAVYRTAGNVETQRRMFAELASALTDAAMTMAAGPAMSSADRRKKYAEVMHTQGVEMAANDTILMTAVPDDPFKAKAHEERLRLGASILALAKQYVATLKNGKTLKYAPGEQSSKAIEITNAVNEALISAIDSADPTDLQSPMQRLQLYERTIEYIFLQYEPMAYDWQTNKDGAKELDIVKAQNRKLGLSETPVGMFDVKIGGQAIYQLRSQIRHAVSGVVGPSFGAAHPYSAMPVIDQSGAAAVMGPGQVTYGSERYIPTMPKISSVQQSTRPCMFEHQIRKGPGFWKWKCERAGKPGVKKCNLVRVEKDQSTLVPVNCAQQVVSVTKGYDVQKTTTTLPNGQVISRQYVTPEVAVIGNVRKLGPAGPGIPVRMSPEQEAAMKQIRDAQAAASPYGQLLSEGETVMFGGRGAGRQYAHPNGQRTAGSAQSQAQPQQPQVGGQQSQVGGQYVRLPSRTAVRNKEVQFGPEDVQNFELGGLPGVIKQPEAWADLPPPMPNEIAFYTHDDSYGTTNNRHRAYGFTFSFRHLPYAYMTQQKYLEWLVSLSYRLRHEWSKYHNHVYDPLKDTIATVESYILVTLGRLEADDKFFNRRDLFQGAEEFRSVMHPILAAYAFRPPQRTWYSPLSARYLDGAKDSEAEAIDNVEKMARAVVSLMNSQLKIDEVITLNAKDANVMAIMEDTLMALLARLQFLHGYVLNTYYSDGIAITGFFNADGTAAGADVRMQDMVRNGLLSIGQTGQRRYLTKELARYLEMFQLDDEASKPLHYLPQLRLRQAREQGLVIPTIDAAATAPAAAMALPLASAMKPVPPNEYQTIITQPSTMVMPAGMPMGMPMYVAPAAAGGNDRRTSRKKSRSSGPASPVAQPPGGPSLRRQ